ncbi:toxic anion resistance protein [Undibacterium sp. SXout20W]|uniref:toxic anion resistance protein n=1 Tax=Undibacterium sp. SXout20W TaxID=3413051 RepID=UPI003BEF7F1D
MSESKTETELMVSPLNTASLYDGNPPMLHYELQADRQIDLNKFSDEQKARINQIATSVSFSDTNSLMSFGADAQRELSKHLDQLLEGMRTSEAGRAGEITIALATTLKDLNLPKIKQEVAGQNSLAEQFGKIPFVGEWFSALRALQQNHKKITEHLNAIEQKSQAQLTTLRSTNEKLDRLVHASIEHIKNMELYMAAGQILIKRARLEFEQKRVAVEQSRDVVEIAKLRDFAEQINAFETRIVRMHIAHSQSIVSVPEIRATQTAATIEMNNVMDSILFDLPALKRAIVNVAALAETAKASKATDARRALSRELNGIGSDQLQDAYLRAKNSQGDFAADIAALSQSADKLLQTIALGRRLDIENADKREKSINDLNALNHKFTNGLLESGDQFVQKLSS